MKVHWNMTELIRSNNVSEAWMQAMIALEKAGGETTNLIVSFQSPVFECPAITAALDDLLRPHPKAYSVSKVAGTIFPWEFYLPDRLGSSARTHLYENHRLARIIEDRRNNGRNYFDRMVRWRGRNDQEINQLEKKICYYKNEVGRNHQACNAFEISLAAPAYPDEDVLVYDPEKDSSPYGFPCLSHISVSLSKNKLHMTATYRNHYFLQKAYGNYVGLIRLLNFLAREIGVEAGELVCVSTHADDEIASSTWFNHSNVEQLLLKCESYLQTMPTSQVALSYTRPTLVGVRAAVAA